MRSVIRAGTICSALLLAAARVVAGAEPAKAYRWEEEAKKRGINAEDRKLLDKNKILVTQESFKQVFTPYISSDIPIFITSDSLLNGFHVLFEESILRLENANARKLL